MKTMTTRQLLTLLTLATTACGACPATPAVEPPAYDAAPDAGDRAMHVIVHDAPGISSDLDVEIAEHRECDAKCAKLGRRASVRIAGFCVCDPQVPSCAGEYRSGVECRPDAIAGVDAVDGGAQ